MKTVGDTDCYEIDEVVERTGATKSQLMNWRNHYYKTEELTGPRFVKVGQTVLYPVTSVENYIEEVLK